MGIELGTFTGFILLGFLSWKLGSLVKYVTSKHYGEAITQVVIFGIGIGIAFAVGASDWAEETVVGNRALSDINGVSKALVGIVIASTGSGLYDFKKAFDGSDSATEPALMPHQGDTPPA